MKDGVRIAPFCNRTEINGSSHWETVAVHIMEMQKAMHSWRKEHTILFVFVKEFSLNLITHLDPYGSKLEPVCRRYNGQKNILIHTKNMPSAKPKMCEILYVKRSNL